MDRSRTRVNINWEISKFNDFVFVLKIIILLSIIYFIAYKLNYCFYLFYLYHKAHFFIIPYIIVFCNSTGLNGRIVDKLTAWISFILDELHSSAMILCFLFFFNSAKNFPQNVKIKLPFYCPHLTIYFINITAIKKHSKI